MLSYMLMQLGSVTSDRNTSAVAAPAASIADATSGAVAVSATKTSDDCTPASSSAGLTSTLAAACPAALSLAMIATVSGWNSSRMNLVIPATTPDGTGGERLPGGGDEVVDRQPVADDQRLVAVDGVVELLVADDDRAGHDEGDRVVVGELGAACRSVGDGDDRALDDLDRAAAGAARARR